jgi:hypothetical protein
MAANIEVTGYGRRLSYAPLIVLLLVAAVVAATYFITRPAPAPVERTESATSFGLGRDALVASGYTGRLGGVAGFQPAPGGQVAGFHGGTNAVAPSTQNWVASAIDAGFTGQVGAATTGTTDWSEAAKQAGYTGRAGAASSIPIDWSQVRVDPGR